MTSSPMPVVTESMARDIWSLLLAFRLVNALLVQTFFQPDEYFQSLEPAWQMAFGPQSGAWITWEWQHQLRSSLHPTLFAGIYFIANKLMELLSCFPQFRAMILSVLPNLVQGVFAAAGDFYTWQLAEKFYGVGSHAAMAALLMTLLSPWQWFCSTRSFSNSLETTMTIAALYYWPWGLTSNLDSVSEGPTTQTSVKAAQVPPTEVDTTPVEFFNTPQSVKHLRIALVVAGTACILRPTNLLIWFGILMPVLTNLLSPKIGRPASDYVVLVREAALCGSVAILISLGSDRLYFGSWTFPPYHWLNFNISQNLAVFYGRNDWHYYLSQGLPLLLTTFLPFTLAALYESTSLPDQNPRFVLSTTIFVTLAALSLISHKEVRFIYPLLPLLHVVTAPTIYSFFAPATTQPVAERKARKMRSLVIGNIIVLLNVGIAFYATQYHQRGVIDVMPYLRQQYEKDYLSPRGKPVVAPDHAIVGFLMPCHSTPWRSQLFYPELNAWALGCEPPIHLAPHSKERSEYRDEADRFYDDMDGFLVGELGTEERPWPRFVVGFDGLQEVLARAWKEEARRDVSSGWEVVERKRFWNSHWHDDSRRQGDVVVWEMVGPVYLEE